MHIQFTLLRDRFEMSVDLSLPDSGVTAIFGPSGSGKTTLLRAIAGLERIPDATISFHDQIWQDSETFLPVYKRPIGYVFQEPSLFMHLNVQQNLAYGLSRLKKSRHKIALDTAIDLLDIGALLSRQPATLSGGEQQRVAIARTLAVSPELLLMDEPLSSLDHKLKLEILPYLESLHQEFAIPILYVSHATDEVARLADTLVVIKNGNILGNGPVQEMLTRLDLPLSHRRDAETLITGKVSEIDHEYGLTRLEYAGHFFTVSGIYQEVGTHVRLRIAAHDVSLTLEKQTGTSMQNIFPVTVTELNQENISQVMVKLMLENQPVLARLTRKSVEELSLHPGKQMYAQIKSIAVLA